MEASMEEEANAQGGQPPVEHPSPANEQQEKIAGKMPKRKCSRALPIIGAVLALIVLSLAVTAILMRGPQGSGNEGDGSSSFELPLDEVASEMISGFDGLRFSVTNGEHIVEIGNFVAKRVSAVNGRVRVNFNATAYEQSSGGRWETSVLIEFLLVGDGSKLKGDDIAVRRCHVYDLPKTLGNDELEYNPAVVSVLKDGLQRSKDVVSDSQNVVDVKLTTDDNVRISWEIAK